MYYYFLISSIINQGLDESDSQASGWNKVPVVAMETHGANCLSAARSAGKSVTLPAITSIATSLGALKVADALLHYCQDQVISSNATWVTVFFPNRKVDQKLH